MMLVYSAAAIAVVFGLLWLAVRLTVIASMAIERKSREGAVRRARRVS